MEQRRAAVFARLDRVKAERAARRQLRREAAGPGVEAEVDKFWKAFNDGATSMRQSMGKVVSDHEAGKPVADTVASWTTSFAQLRKHAADAVSFLPAYDAEQATKSLIKLQKDLRRARMAVLPRKKFRFTQRPRGGGATSAPAATGSGASDAVDDPIEKYEVAEKCVSGLSNRTLLVCARGGLHADRAAVQLDRGDDLRILNLTDCTVVVLGTPRALRVDSLRNCHVYAYAVEGSVLLHDCSNCAFQLASRQVRLHTSQHCDFYLRVRSRPIIEHCTTLRFAPYSLAAPGIETAQEEAGLVLKEPAAAAAAAGLWREVDDFDWHKQQASPNWSVLPAGRRMVRTRDGPATIAEEAVAVAEAALASGAVAEEAAGDERAAGEALAEADEVEAGAGGGGEEAAEAAAAGEDSDSDDEEL